MSAVVAQEHKIPTGTLKQVPIKDIKVGERFRKDFSGDKEFQESIREKGILQPITLDKQLNLLAGERRLRAASAIGLEKIPALVREVEGEVDAREIELYENTFRKDFTWQEKVKLVAEIDRLYKEKNVDWSGRKTAELLNQSVMNVARTLQLAKAMDILPELAEQPTASDAHKVLKRMEEQVIVAELAKRQQENLAAILPKEFEEDGVTAKEPPPRPSDPGQAMQWDLAQRLRIASNNYHEGEDTFEALAGLPDNGVIHIIECDPPYGIDLANIKASKDDAGSNVHSYKEIPEENYEDFLQTIARELFRVAGRDCWLVFWFGPTWHTEVKKALVDAGWLVDDIPCIWVKNQGQTLQPEVYLARFYEPFFLCRKGQPFMNQRGRSNVFSFPNTPSAQKYHPTERPVELINAILNTLGVPNQTVFVPFLGSGATLRACYILGMRCFGYDLSTEYKDRFMLAVEEEARLLVSAPEAQA